MRLDFVFVLLVIAAQMTETCLAANRDGTSLQLSPRGGKRFDREKLKSLRNWKGNSTEISQLKRVSWQVDGMTREALVYVPPLTDKKCPLIFAGGSVRAVAIR